MRLLDRLLKPTVARLVAAYIEEERVDALYRYRVHSDPPRLTIHPTAVVSNAIFNTGGGRITVGEYVFFGHNVCVLAGVHEVDQFGLERQRTIPAALTASRSARGLIGHQRDRGRTGEDRRACRRRRWIRGAQDVEPYAVVAGNPARPSDT